MESEPKKLRLLEEVPRYIPHSVAFPPDTETLPRTIALVWVILSAPLVVTDMERGLSISVVKDLILPQ